MRAVPSPNFNQRAANIALEYVILHYTGMRNAQEALARLCDPATEVSAHYMLDEDGTIYHLVDEKFRSWHAGKSFWRGIVDMNSASIGIELVNPGHEFGYRSFPATQIDALKNLLRDIYARHDLEPHALLAHSDVAPTRKEDPGELFPWPELAASGYGLWPQLTHQQASETMSLSDVSSQLHQIGYDISDIEKTLYAFQRRYTPEHMTGQCDTMTAAMIMGLKKLLPY